MMVPYDRPHVMEGVVGILLTARRLLDAAELSIVGKHVLAVPTNWPGGSDQTSNSLISVLRCHPWISNADTT